MRPHATLVHAPIKSGVFTIPPPPTVSARARSQLQTCAHNGDPVRLCKVELQQFATATGLAVTVCPLPPGTSTWHTIEHRLFAHSSLSWRGPGCRCAELGTGSCPTKVKVSDEELAAVQPTPHAFHGEWHPTVPPALSRPDL